MGAGWRLFVFGPAEEDGADEAHAEECKAKGEDGAEGLLRAEDCLRRSMRSEEVERASKQGNECSDEEQAQGNWGEHAGGDGQVADRRRHGALLASMA